MATVSLRGSASVSTCSSVSGPAGTAAASEPVPPRSWSRARHTAPATCQKHPSSIRHCWFVLLGGTRVVQSVETPRPAQTAPACVDAGSVPHRPRIPAPGRAAVRAPASLPSNRRLRRQRRLRLQPDDVLGRERDRARQVIDDDRQLPIAVFLVESRNGDRQRLIEAPRSRCRRSGSASTSTLRRSSALRRRRAKPRSFEPVDHRRRGASRQTRYAPPVVPAVVGPPRPSRSRHSRSVGIGADELGHGVAQQHRLRADLPERLVQRLEQFVAGRRGFGHKLS